MQYGFFLNKSMCICWGNRQGNALPGAFLIYPRTLLMRAELYKWIGLLLGSPHLQSAKKLEVQFNGEDGLWELIASILFLI